MPPKPQKHISRDDRSGWLISSKESRKRTKTSFSGKKKAKKKNNKGKGGR